MNGRVLVMMSGGVDSSVAAALLRDEGHDVTGVTLKLWGGESDSGCCSVADVEDARRVAAQLGIPHYVFNFADAFAENVVTPYVDAYAVREDAESVRRVQPHHEVRARRSSGPAARLRLRRDRTPRSRRRGPRARARGADPAKDQSYVLYMLGAEQLARTLLPVGELTKADVRAYARELGLRTAAKRESMDVCFIKRGGREAFLGARIGRRPGSIVDERGRTSSARTTVSTRSRSGSGAVSVWRSGSGATSSTSTPKRRRVTVGRHAALLRDRVRLRDLVLHCEPPRLLLAQYRAHGAAVPATLAGDEVVFDTPQPRIAPGQVVALYDDDVCCGGGIVAA